MFERFIKYKKIDEILDKKLNEVKISFVFTTLIVIIFEILKVYENINNYNEAFKNITIYIAAALIGVLGIILAGISIITSSLNRKNMSLIEKVNGNDVVERILTSFEFLAFLVGTQIISFFIIYICLYSSYSMPSKLLFYMTIVLVIYLFIFSIFYTVALVGNSIQFFLSAQKYNEINSLDKTVISILNEVKIDFLFKLLCENKNISSEDLINSLYKYCKDNNYEKKDEVMEYFKDLYDIK